MTARAAAYDRHTGRYGLELSHVFLQFACVEPGSSALDVGASDDTADDWCTRNGLRVLWEQAGLADVETAALAASAPYDELDDAWFSFASGVGTSGAYCRSLDERRQACCARSSNDASMPPDGPFRLTARAWTVGGRVPLDHD